MLKQFLSALIVVAVGLPPQDSLAQYEWVSGIDSAMLGPSVITTSGDFGYVADQAGRSVKMINVITGAYVGAHPLPGVPLDLAIDVYDQRIAIALGSAGIAVLNQAGPAPSLSIVSTRTAGSVAFDRFGRLYFADSQGIGMLAAENYAYVGRVPTPFTNALLIRMADGDDHLYAATRGISPASVYRFRISQENSLPVYLNSSVHGEVGSNMKDMVVSPQLTYLALASGSPYGAQLVNPFTLRIEDVVNTSPYPAAVTTTNSGRYLFQASANTLSDEDSVFQIDPFTSQIVRRWRLPPAAGGNLLDLTPNSLIYSESRRRLYVSIESSQGIFGVLAINNPMFVGDTNCDGELSVQDVGPFVRALIYPDQYEAIHGSYCHRSTADITGDGYFTVADIGPFVDAILN